MDRYTFELGAKKHVFVDWDLIEPGYGLVKRDGKPDSWEAPYGVRIAVHRPRIDRRPVIRADSPWEGILLNYATLFEDEGRYRLYYTCTARGKGGVEKGWVSNLAYAESADGVEWVKPKIGTVSFDGSTDNNLVYKGHTSTVFKDPSAPPDERYKLVELAGENGMSLLLGAVSPDGLRWKALEKPILSDYASDTQTVMRFDPEKARYVGYFRGISYRDAGKWYGRWHGRRVIAYAETDRFESWPVPEQLVGPDVHDGPDTDIYTNAYSPWPDADAHLMFPAFFHHGLDTLDVHIMTSRDGLHWERPLREPIVPVGEPGSGREGMNYAGNGIVSVKPGEWSIPIASSAVGHSETSFIEDRPARTDLGSVFLATWRQDGFTSLEAESEGKCTTAPLTLAGSRLEVNAWTRLGGEIRVELVDAVGKPISSQVVAGRRFEDCDPITGDVLNGTVSWNGDSDLSEWTGKPVRLRFHMRRARLHAIRSV